MNFRSVVCVLSVWIGLATSAFAGDLDRYRYVLEKSTNDKVCRHMQKVYNEYFSYPWKQPSSHTGAYGPETPYAFPKLPGVNHDDRMTLDMSFSRLPTSPEFEAIEWKEGRYRFISLGEKDHGDQPMLVAEMDIDNDGRMNTVIKKSFMLTYYGSRGRGGEDSLLVFERGEIDLSQSIKFGLFNRVQAGRNNPALITALPGVPYRSIRPLVLEGVTYLSGYQQAWKSDNVVGPEHMHVVRFRGTSENPDRIDKRNIVHLDRICEFRMRVLKQRKKGN